MIIIKNNTLYNLAYGIHFLSLISLSFVIWGKFLSFKDHPILSTFYWIGSVGYIITGFLFFVLIVSAEWGEIIMKNFIVGLGLGAWTLLIICNVYNIFWNLARMMTNILLFLFCITYFLIFEPQNLKILSFAITIRDYGSPQMSFYDSIIHLFLVLAGFVMGTIILVKIKTLKNKIKPKLKIFCPICQNEVKEKKHFCNTCGANLKIFKPLEKYVNY